MVTPAIPKPIITMTTKTYNGWTNYETWAVALWLDNSAQQARAAIARATGQGGAK